MSLSIAGGEYRQSLIDALAPLPQGVRQEPSMQWFADRISEEEAEMIRQYVIPRAHEDRRAALAVADGSALAPQGPPA